MEKVIISIISSVSAIIIAVIKFRKRSTKIKELNLLKHPIRENLLALRSKIIYNFSVPKDVSGAKIKEDVAREILVRKIDNWITHFEQIKKSKHMTLEDNYRMHLRILRSGIEFYCSFFKNDNYSQDEKFAIKVILSYFRSKKLHGKQEKKVSDMIEYFHDHANYINLSITQINYLLLDVYNASFIEMYRDIELAIQQINGRLNGKVFRERVYEARNN